MRIGYSLQSVLKFCWFIENTRCNILGILEKPCEQELSCQEVAVVQELPAVLGT